MKQIYLLILLAGLSGLYSCSVGLLASFYGMKKIKPIKEKTINRYAKRYHIPLEDSYEMDTSYFTFLFSHDSIRYKKQIKNHVQPLQVLYFDKTRQLVSFHINCYAGGFPNITWNRNDIMTVFPAKEQAPLDSILTFEKQLSFLRPLKQTEKLIPEKYDYVVIVYWCKFMTRQSKRLVRFAQNNALLEKNQRVKLVYVNGDNVFTKFYGE